MPLISDIASLGNLIVNLFVRLGKVLIEKPHYLIPAILILLFLPLELVDAFLYILVNIFILIINAIILAILIVLNAVLYIVFYPITWLSKKLRDMGNLIDDIPGCPDIDFPVLTVPININYWGVSYKSFNLFGSGGSVIAHNCIFEYMLYLAGLTAPIW